MAQRKKNDTRTKLYATLKIIAVFGLVGLVGAGFLWAERFIEARRPDQAGDLVFVDKPTWVDATLLSRVTDTVGKRFYLQPGVAEEALDPLGGVAPAPVGVEGTVLDHQRQLELSRGQPQRILDVVSQ